MRVNVPNSAVLCCAVLRHNMCKISYTRILYEQFTVSVLLYRAHVRVRVHLAAAAAYGRIMGLWSGSNDDGAKFVMAPRPIKSL